ncbi:MULTISPECIES: aminotransferase [Amycolatopsis]|uniref:Aminotransferase n=2 Tax=Amycolatopsis TaxID=1813 RepID=A0A1I3T353_9PSEU|nr:aminotransferase [Amycolatopsis sacchari]SFJ65578.1 Aspartate/methionine/tyrosine aminotransferase [Amycolatopsis sacchari]
MRLREVTRQQVDSPMGEAYSLLAQRGGARDLLDLAQAAPPYPPAPEVAERLARVAADPHGAAYTPVPGLPLLRETFAAELSRDYGAEVDAANVVITSGCNQAFAMTISALAGPGDEVVLVLPFYFNHDMWLRLNEIVPVYLEPGPDLLPRAEAAEALLSSRTRAIVLVTPGNPSGATIGGAELAAFAALARRHGIALIVDETYRSFREDDGPAHALFTEPGWEDTVVSLHSFSKDLAIPGYRVGAIVGSPALNREVLKLLDCAAICAPRAGQEAVLTGLTSAGAWRRERVAEIARRRHAFAAVMADRPGGFTLLSAGAFFGWVRHPFRDRPTGEVVRQLIAEYDTLVIPGTAFWPGDPGTVRVSYSNLGPEGVAELAARLALAGKER